MTLDHAFTLGAIQGLTEFLPVSSSGHLIALPWLFGWPAQPLAFDVALHLGTLGAVFSALLREWRGILSGAFDVARGRGGGTMLERTRANEGARLLVLIVIASVPGGVAGLLLDDLAERTFRSALLVAGTMAGLGVLLFLADRFSLGRRGLADWSVRDAFLMGCAQATALVPGVSRSGATISAALALGYQRDAAARLSFLMALPLTLAACFLKVPALVAAGVTPDLIVGISTAFAFGFASIGALFRWVRTRSYLPFVVYRLLFAGVIAAAWFSR
jgi:undecaprenyl-diphosphatase